MKDLLRLIGIAGMLGSVGLGVTGFVTDDTKFYVWAILLFIASIGFLFRRVASWLFDAIFEAF